MINYKKIKERRQERYEKYREMLSQEIKSIVREAMEEWTSDCAYLTKSTDKEGRYYCSKSDCEEVRFSEQDK